MIKHVCDSCGKVYEYADLTATAGGYLCDTCMSHYGYKRCCVCSGWIEATIYCDKFAYTDSCTCIGDTEKPLESDTRLMTVEAKLQEAMEMCIRPEMEAIEVTISKALDCVAQVTAGPSRCRRCKNWNHSCAACRLRKPLSEDEVECSVCHCLFDPDELMETDSDAICYSCMCKAEEEEYNCSHFHDAYREAPVSSDLFYPEYLFWSDCMPARRAQPLVPAKPTDLILLKLAVARRMCVESNIPSVRAKLDIATTVIESDMDYEQAVAIWRLVRAARNETAESDISNYLEDTISLISGVCRDLNKMRQ